MKLLKLLFAGLLFFFALSAQAGLEEGKAAFKNTDYEAAMKELLPLAESGNAEAQSLVAYLYKKRPRSKELTNFWFLKAAAQNEPFAMYEVGFACKMQNNNEGLMYTLCPASNLNDITEILLLSEHYFNKALVIFEERANKGDYRAQEYLGSMYAFGNGASKNKEKAQYWLTKSVVQGDIEAAGYLTGLYADYAYYFHENADYLLQYEWEIIWSAMSSIKAKANFHWGSGGEGLKKAGKRRAIFLAKQWLKQNGREKELKWVEAQY